MEARNLLKRMDFYLVTDSGLSRRGTTDDVRRALDAGCVVVQYREKNKNTRAMIQEALDIRNLCRGRALFIVNDRVDVALAAGADGVHLGQDDMPFATARRLLGARAVIGITAHNLEEALEAERLGADYIGVSPVFATGTKKDAGEACGLVMVETVRRHVRIPIVAIGGITKGNVASVIRAGADSAAAISAVVSAEDAGKEVAGFIRIIREAKNDSPPASLTLGPSPAPQARDE